MSSLTCLILNMFKKPCRKAQGLGQVISYTHIPYILHTYYKISEHAPNKEQGTKCYRLSQIIEHSSANTQSLFTLKQMSAVCSWAASLMSMLHYIEQLQLCSKCCCTALLRDIQHISSAYCSLQ